MLDTELQSYSMNPSPLCGEDLLVLSRLAASLPLRCVRFQLRVPSAHIVQLVCCLILKMGLARLLDFLSWHAPLKKPLWCVEKQYEISFSVEHDLLRSNKSFNPGSQASKEVRLCKAIAVNTIWDEEGRGKESSSASNNVDEFYLFHTLHKSIDRKATLQNADMRPKS